MIRSFVDVDPPVVANAQTPELIEPRKRALDSQKLFGSWELGIGSWELRELALS
jgi:hypothetical protein